MHYLVDGHNLIAHHPEISLEDPHDEALLIEKLRGFAVRTRKKVVVVFDGGLPGGVSPRLSNSLVQAKFASSGQTSADEIIQGMLHRAKTPQAVTLVSSDREIILIAEARGAQVLSAAAFIQLLSPPSGGTPSARKRSSRPPEQSGSTKLAGNFFQK
ncbi:MAG: NYN domain-containing protein [Anaerolineae bacterium]|nr:NYN domain-containing protein [Anaerolineae bacterium]